MQQLDGHHGTAADCSLLAAVLGFEARRAERLQAVRVALGPITTIAAAVAAIAASISLSAAAVATADNPLPPHAVCFRVLPATPHVKTKAKGWIKSPLRGALYSRSD